MRLEGRTMERLLLVSLCLFAVSIYFSQSGIGVFGPLSLLLLLIWRYGAGYEPERRLPGFLMIAAAVFFLDVFLGALISDNIALGLRGLKKYWNVLLLGMLFTCPLGDGARKTVLAVFLFAASLAGLMGVLQYTGVFFYQHERAMGLTHPVHYANILSYAGATALVMLLVRNDVFTGTSRLLVLVVPSVLALAGIALSQTRGVWISIFLATIATLFIHSAKRALAFAAVLVSVALLVFVASDTLRHRANTIVTSFYTEGAKGSTGNRIELLRGALMLARENPVLGTGTGDFKTDIDQLVSQGRLDEMLSKSHAHNIFLQWLSTQGAVGLLTLVAMLSALFVWGAREIRGSVFGGYVIVVSTLLLVLGGLTENTMGISKIFAAYCLTVGLAGPMGRVEGGGGG